MLWEWLQKSFNVVASHSLHRAPLFHKRDSKCKCTVWIILFKYIETDKEFIKDTMDSTSYLILFFMRPPPAGLINFINVSSCSLIKWAGRVEKTWEKSMYMLLHYCTLERDRVKEVAELRKQTQWPRKKCGCLHIHLIWLVRAAVYFPTQFLLLSRFSALWFYVTRQKITFQASHLTQFTPACWAVSFTICTVGIVIYIVIVISLFIHLSKPSFHHPLLFHLWPLSLKPVNFLMHLLRPRLEFVEKSSSLKHKRLSHRLWVLSLYCSSWKGSRARI